MMLQLNHLDVTTLKVPLSAQSCMTRAEALQLALAQQPVLDAIGGWIIKDSILEVKQDYEINLVILTEKPEGYQQPPKEKKKKKKANRG
jgi:hypothetical protein